MEALFSSEAVSGSDALLIQLTQERADPLHVLFRVAAHHAGWPAGLRPFRDGFVRVGPQILPAPEDLRPLVALLFARGGRLFSECKEPIDDLYVAAFLLWGLLAVHPFDDGNGRTAWDFVHQALMRRIGSGSTLFRAKRIDRRLAPVIDALCVANDGTPERQVAQLADLFKRFSEVTLASLKNDPHFTTLVKVFVVCLNESEA